MERLTSDTIKKIKETANAITDKFVQEVNSNNLEFKQYVSKYLDYKFESSVFGHERDAFRNSINSNEIFLNLNKIASFADKNDIRVIYKEENLKNVVDVGRLNHFLETNKDDVLSIKKIANFFGEGFVFNVFDHFVFANRLFKGLTILRHVFLSDDSSQIRKMNIVLKNKLHSSIKQGLIKLKAADKIDFESTNIEKEISELEAKLNLPEISVIEILKSIANKSHLKDIQTTYKGFAYDLNSKKELFKKSDGQETFLTFGECLHNLESIDTFIETLESRVDSLTVKLKLFFKDKKEDTFYAQCLNSIMLNDNSSNNAFEIDFIKKIKDCQLYFDTIRTAQKRIEELKNEKIEIENSFSGFKHTFNFILRSEENNAITQKRIEELKKHISNLKYEYEYFEKIELLNDIEKQREKRNLFLKEFDQFANGFSFGNSLIKHTLKDHCLMLEGDLDFKAKSFSYTNILNKLFSDSENLFFIEYVDQLNKKLNSMHDRFVVFYTDFYDNDNYSSIKEIVELEYKGKESGLSDDEKVRFKNLYSTIYAVDFKQTSQTKLKRAI